MADGKSYTAHLVGSDNSTDLAVIKISAPASELHPLTLGDSSKVEVGDPVVAIGSPFGLAGTVTSGIVSALTARSSRRTTPRSATRSRPTRRTTTATRGPADRRRPRDRRQLADPERLGRQRRRRLRDPVEHPRLGRRQIVAGKTSPTPISASRSRTRLPGRREAGEVLPGTAAAKAGLKSGDIVTKLDGKAVAGQSTSRRSSTASGPARSSASPTSATGRRTRPRSPSAPARPSARGRVTSGRRRSVHL